MSAGGAAALGTSRPRDHVMCENAAMAPPVPLFEFVCHGSISSLEIPLAMSTLAMERLAEACDSGEAYTTHHFFIRGRWRTVSIPVANLARIQARINSLLFPLDLALRNEVNGFVSRKSTRTNALPHVGATFLQKFDIADFFANIDTEQVDASLRRAGFGDAAAAMLSRLTSCNGQVPLGARTSPRISNLVLMSFDDTMASLAARKGIVYSRYADDVSFSSTTKDFDVHHDVAEELAKHGFALNPSKTKKFRHGQPMFVTGLAVSDVSYPRLRKRLKSQLRREFYYIEKHGIEGHATAVGQSPHRVARRLLGQFHYARSIEPAFTSKLETSYPKSFGELIPQRGDDRIERAQRHRTEFLREVARAPVKNLPFYRPEYPLPD